MMLRFSVAAVLLAAGCTQESPAPPAAAPPAVAEAVGSVAPERAAASASGVKLQILDVAGLEQLVASHRGKVVVVDAWSTSCEPCLKEFPNLVAMGRELGPERLACVSLSLDFDGIGRPEEKQAKVLKFLERFGATFDNVLASEEADAVMQRLDFYAPPAVFVYDRAGKLSKKFGVDGPFTYADVRQQVDTLLATP
jgi:thiol-disulfide isomerase/thioredoxin